jgi:NADH-quinone oxidoreductase subunit L
MEAPVPASALIHSATLVSAGVYLVGRFYLFFQETYFLLIILGVVGILTAMVGAIIAAYQTDLKKTLAYSTISHCGILFFLLTLPNIWYFLIYLVLHGIFKSISFVIAGELILLNNNYQDWRKMGNNLSNKKIYFFVLFFCLGNLCSLPLTIGFFSKNLFLLCGVAITPAFTVIFIFLLFVIGVCSLVYFSRIIYFVFFGRNTNAVRGFLLQNEWKITKQGTTIMLSYLIYLLIIAGLCIILYSYYYLINFYLLFTTDSNELCKLTSLYVFFFQIFNQNNILLWVFLCFYIVTLI